MLGILKHRLKDNWLIVSNTFSVAGTTAVTSGLGFIYWWVAARQFPTTTVGLASACISAMTLLGTMAMLGLGTLLIGELPRQPQRKAVLITTALLISGLVGLGSGLLFALVAPLLSSDLGILNESWQNIFFFGCGVSLTALTLVLDQILIGLLRGGMQLWRNFMFAASKLVILGVVGYGLNGNKGGLAIYLTWLMGNVLSLVGLGVIISLQTRGKGKVLRPVRPDWHLLRSIGRKALGHHLLNLALQMPGLALPVLVTALLSAATNAHFYVAWMIASFVFVGPFALTTVLYAVNAADQSALAQKTRFTLRLAFLVGLLANLVLLVGAEQILSLFGPVYAQEAAGNLRLLGLGVFAITIKDHYIAIQRIQGRVLKAAGWVALASLVEMLLPALGAVWAGLNGLSLGWLLALYLEAAFMLGLVYRTARRPVSAIAVEVAPSSPVVQLTNSGKK